VYGKKRAEDKPAHEEDQCKEEDAASNVGDTSERREKARKLLSGYPRLVRDNLEEPLANMLAGELPPGNVSYIPFCKEDTGVDSDAATFYAGVWNRKSNMVIARGADAGNNHVIIAIERSEQGNKTRLSAVTVHKDIVVANDHQEFDFGSKFGRTHFHHGSTIPRDARIAEISSDERFIEQSVSWLLAYAAYLAIEPTASEDESQATTSKHYNLRRKAVSCEVRSRGDSGDASDDEVDAKKAAQEKGKLQRELKRLKKELANAKKATPAMPSTPAGPEVVVDTPTTQPTVPHTPMTQPIVPHVEEPDHRGHFSGWMSVDEAELRTRYMLERSRRRQLEDQLQEYEIEKLYRKK
jgi:hypothetical protein